jgi:hypothetical protein
VWLLKSRSIAATRLRLLSGGLMKSRILPIVWGVVAYATFFASIFVSARLGAHPVIVIVLSWGIAVFATIVVNVLLIGYAPDLRFSTKDKIDGMGYVHSVLDVLMPLTMIAILIAVALICRTSLTNMGNPQ